MAHSSRDCPGEAPAWTSPFCMLPCPLPSLSDLRPLRHTCRPSFSLDPYLRSSFKRDFCGASYRPFSALFATYRPSPPQPSHHGPGTLMLDHQKAMNPPFGARAPILTAWRPVKNPPDWCVWRLVVSCAFLQSAAPTNSRQHSRTYVRGHAKVGVPSPTSRLGPAASAVKHGSKACPGPLHLLLCVSQRGLL